MTQENQSTAPLMTVTKNKYEEWRIDVREYRGQQYVDLQLWYRDAAGVQRPSNKGHASIRPNLVGQIVQGLMLAANAAQTR